ncbi:MAG: hypothetical protein ACR2H5_18490 [Ktedonobacteraceae bacterium]
MDEQKAQPQPDPVHQPGTGKGEEKPKTEGKEAGRHNTGTTGEANRPAGKTTAQTSTGVNPTKENPVDPESPHLPTP